MMRGALPNKRLQLPSHSAFQSTLAESGVEPERFGRATEALWLAAEPPIRWAAGLLSQAHTTSRRPWLILVAATIAAFSGCQSTVPAYDGPRHSQDHVAVLRVDGNGRFLEIDQRRVDGRSFELLPGNHTVRVRVQREMKDLHKLLEGRWARVMCVVQFEANAGHVYFLKTNFTAPELVSSQIGEGTVSETDLQAHLMDVKTGSLSPVAQADCQRL